MSDPWICIIGGGRSQLPFIEAAGRHGLATIVFDRAGDPRSRLAATEFVQVSTHDTPEVLDHLRRSPRDLAGCFTYSSYEGALTTTAAVVDRFGLRGLTGEAVSRTSSKLAMRRHLGSAGVPAPVWLHTDDVEELEAFRNQHGRVMVKPARGGVGSQGVAMIDGDGDGDGAVVLAAACASSSDGSALIESYVDGVEYSVDGFVTDGVVHVLAVSRKHSGGPGAPFVIGGYVLGDGVTDRGPDLRGLADTTLGALVLDNSYFSLDVIDDGDALYVVDAGPLLDAKIDRLLHYCGVDVYGIAADIALGGPCEIAEPSPGVHALRFLYAERPGVIRAVDPGTFSGVAGDLVLEMEKTPGKRVGPPESVADVVGWVMASGTDAGAVWSELSGLDLADRIDIGEPA